MEIFRASTTDKPLYKCRCCQNPSNIFLELDNPENVVDGPEKTYKDILYEITHLKILPEQEESLPQKICHKCCTQLQNSYRFIQQAREISEQYLLLTRNIKEEKTESFEHLPEKLIELPDNILAYVSHKQIKEEPPLNIECSPEELKLNDVEGEESEHAQILEDENNFNNLESQEEREYLIDCNTDSSDEDEDNETVCETVCETVSENDTGVDKSNESEHRCCDVCQKVYINERVLNVHKRYAHMPDEEKLPSPLCAYKSSRSSALKVHIAKIHGNDNVSKYFKTACKEFSCSKCSRSYTRQDSLVRHISRTHLCQKPKKKASFICTYCAKSFTSKRGLKAHKLTHTGDRPYSCNICSKTFKRLNDLQLHSVIHSDKKPHQCSECGKAFKRGDKLKIHMRVHSELRPYKCNECEKAFKYPNVLKLHMHKHTGETPYSCKTCGEAFSLRTKLKSHCLKYDHVK